MDKPDIVPIDALFDEGVGPNLSGEHDPRESLATADVILGVDVMTEREFLVYGRDALEDVTEGGEPRPMVVLRVGLDQETDELEKLIALVQTTRGRNDYQVQD